MTESYHERRLTLALAVWHSELSKAASRGKGVRSLFECMETSALTVTLVGH
jgi:hypothetical protein